MRYTYRKGSLWIFIFIALALIPLVIALLGNVPEKRAFWIELGVAFGFISLAIFCLQFLFSGRFGWIAPTFGMDNIIQYHREFGIIAFIFLIAHPVTLLIAEPDFISYFDPGINAPRAIALILVVIAAVLILSTSLWRLNFGLSYEKWRLIHGVLGILIIFIGLGHSVLVAHYLGPLWKAAAISIYVGISMYLLAHTRIVRPWLNSKKPYRIVKVQPERGDCYSITLDPLKGESLRFISGQFAWITIGDTPFQLQQHPFSIASSDRQKQITFTAKEMGDFTSTWKDIPPGTKAFLEGPFGSFTYEDDSHLFLIMGGIGMTPGMSMLRKLRDDTDRRKTILIYGNKNWEEITFREELEEISKVIDLKVVHILEEPHEGWKGETGLLNQEILKKYLPEKPNEYMYFICGPMPLMDVSEISLRNLRIEWRRIYTERFEIV